MLYRTIQRRLRALGSSIRLNQKKVILLQELDSLMNHSLEFVVLQRPEEIRSYISTMDKELLCGRLGNDVYWHELETNPVDIIVKAIQDNTVVGFVMIRNNYVCKSTGCTIDGSSNSFYIELICSKGNGVGGKMIDHVKMMAISQKKSFLYLSALFDVITYYAKRHNFRISTDCYPQLEMEIAQLFDLHTETRHIAIRRQQLSYQITQKPNKRERSMINSERSDLSKRMKIATGMKRDLLDTFRKVSTYSLKYPDRNATTDDVLEQGVFMSFCL
jgi:hypothetical protein